MTKQLSNNNTNIFRPLNYFMVRSPLLSLNFYQDLYSNSSGKSLEYSKVVSNIKKSAKLPIIQEAILVSSKSLYHSIIDWESITDIKRDKKVVNSLNRYLIRMSTRPTPFGLFSGVNYGTFDNITNFKINHISEHEKRTRPDMAWLLSIVGMLENDFTVLEQLKVHKNPITFISGNRYLNPYNSQGGSQTITSTIESISINNNELIEFLLNLAEESIDISDIINLILKKYPAASKENVLNLISQLIEKDYLITNLRPPLTNKSPFLYLIEQIKLIKGKEGLTKELVNILRLLKEYDKSEIGSGLEILTDIKREMKKITETKTLVQVDTRINTSNVKLNSKVGEEVSKLAEILWRISPNNFGLKHLTQYRNDFIEKYGIYREVPLLELLDEDQGLGAPATYKNPVSRRKVSNENNVKYEDKQSFLLNKIMEAINLKKIEIHLDEQDLKVLEYEDINEKMIPRSLELYGNVVAESQEAIDKGEFNFVMGINSGSDSAGKTFGRFLDIIDNKKVNESLSCQEKNDEQVYAELVYLPVVGRASNVVLTQHESDFEIVIGTNSSKDVTNTIPVSDILVGSTLDRMYLKSKRLGKEIKIKVNHMLNNSTAPNLYRFLSEISSEGIKQWSPFTWYSLESSTFLPRVKVGKSILSLARWNINPQSLLISNNMDFRFEKWKKSFREFSDTWSIPRWVYQTVGDNRILLDLENSLHLEDLYTQMKKLKVDEYITLYEKEESNLISWTKDKNGHNYNVEYVFPLARTYESSLERIRPKNIKEPLSSASKVVRKYPGGDWLFIKLYGSSSRENDLICFYLKKICDEILENEYIEKYFFMRYADPDKHIRLRFHGKSTVLNQKLMPLLHDYFHELNKEGVLTKITIDTYEREVERYGGVALIDKAETLFHYDSRSVEKLLYLHRFNHTNLDLDIIATLSVLHYLKSFGLSFDEKLAWLDDLTSRKNYLKDFRKIKNKLVPLYLNIQEDLDSNIEGLKEVLEAIDFRKDAVDIYVNDIYKNNKENKLDNSLFDIFGSVIHMNLNRLLGIDRERENKIMTLARHTLYNSRYLRELVK